MRQVTFPDGRTVPALGQGTWRMGEDPRRAAAETEAILAGLDAGMSLVDTAEMYGDGATESWLGAALAGRRDEVFLVSKAVPRNASRDRLTRSCEASLKRLRSDRLDLYLLHWPGSVPLAETVEAMEALKAAGKIGAWGVSNFDVDNMEALVAVGGEGCAVNQVLYNVTRRGPEHDLVPWLDGEGIPLMAYSPVEQGRLLARGALAEVAERHGATPYQVALAWTMRAGALSIPKAASLAHVRDNRAAADLVLDVADLAAIDAEFAPPQRKRALEIL